MRSVECLFELFQRQLAVVVVLEASANAYSDDWAVVQPAVGALTRTCAYDRAGFGWSEPDGGQPGPETLARNLRAVSRCGHQPVYVLFGHSVGGAHIRMFTALYPDDVAGLVFVETRHKSSIPSTALPHKIWLIEAYESFLKLYRVLRDLGIARLLGLSLGPSVNPVFNHYPDEVAC